MHRTISNILSGLLEAGRRALVTCLSFCVQDDVVLAGDKKGVVSGHSIPLSFCFNWTSGCSLIAQLLGLGTTPLPSPALKDSAHHYQLHTFTSWSVAHV